MTKPTSKDMEPDIRTGMWSHDSSKKEKAARLPIDPAKVNKRTGRLETQRPEVESIGAHAVYAARFGDLYTGKRKAFIAGSGAVFSDGEMEYSLEAVPGGYAMLFDTETGAEGVLVCELLDLPPSPKPRAQALLEPVAAALRGLGFKVPEAPPTKAKKKR